MPAFIEYLRNHPWVLQIIQHTISLHAQVPIRLADKSMIFKNIPIYDTELLEKIKTFELSLDEIPSHIKKYFSKRSNSSWITRTSNVHPLFHALRRDKRWLAWENYFIFYWLREYNDKNEFESRKYANECLTIIATKLKIEEYFDGFIVIGPLFTLQKDISEEIFSKEIVEQFILSLLKVAPGICRTVGYDYPGLLDLGLTRSWSTESWIINRSVRLKRIFHALFSMNYASNEVISLQRCTINSLSQLAYLLHRTKMIELISSLELGGENKRIIIPLKERSINLESDSFLNRSRFCMVVERDQWKIVRKELADASQVWIEATPEEQLRLKEKNKRSIEIIEDSKRSLEVSYSTLHSGYTTGSLNRFWTFLNNEFGLVQHNIVFDTYKLQNDITKLPPSSRIYSQIAKELTILFTADFCSIHIYNYIDNSLSSKFTYLSHEIPFLKVRASELDEKDEYIDSSNSKETCEKLHHKCARTKKPQFVRAYFPETNTYDPPLNTMFSVDNLNKRIRSGLAVPMIVNGRVFGVIEIGGFDNYQFRYANVELGQEIAKVLAIFLYQQEMLGGLAALSKSALEPRVNDSIKYDKIPVVFTNILLADAAALYVPGAIGSGEYKLQAWHHRPDLDKISREFSGISNIPTSMNDSPLANALRKKEVIHYNVSKLEKDHPNWGNKLPQRKMIIDQFDWLIVVPITVFGADQILGGLVLYYKQPVTQSADVQSLEKWNDTLMFLGQYISLLITTIHTKKFEEERIKNMIQHEIKYVINVISNRSSDIVDELSNIEIPVKMEYDQIPHFLKTSVLKKYNDILLYKKEIGKISELLRPDIFEKLLASGLSPAVFLLKQNQEISGNFDPENIDLRKLLIGVFKPLESEFKKYSLIHKYRMPEFIPDVKSIELALLRIFDNLYNNAIKYSLPNTTIRLFVVEREKSIEVTLSNLSIPLKDRNERYRLFESGYRGSNSGLKDGHGLGLGIARDFAEAIRVSLECETKILSRGDCLFLFRAGIPKK